ncbi:MAG: hypothetical protein M3133_09460, partial [Actinomycetota bacterium]|nr:hypothetical protein [Actinomycetota bacterium]
MRRRLANIGEALLLLLLVGVVLWAGLEQVLQFVGVVEEPKKPEEVFAETCRGHGGQVRTRPLECFVRYGGRRYHVPIDPYNRFDEEQALLERQYCRQRRRSERKSAKDGYDRRLDKFVYHRNTGVCE